MTTYIRGKFMGFWNIFKDKNDINEKNIVGFISFTIMVIVAITDVVTSILGIEFIINDYIYNSFLIVTLGSFGISEAGRIFGGRKSRNNSYQPDEDVDELSEYEQRMKNK